MTPAQTALLAYMSQLSRRYFQDTWANGVEYSLWHWLFTPDGAPYTDAERFTLHSRHLAAKGWLVTEGTEVRFLKTDAWLKLYLSEFQEESRKFFYE